MVLGGIAGAAATGLELGLLEIPWTFRRFLGVLCSGFMMIFMGGLWWFYMVVLYGGFIWWFYGDYYGGFYGFLWWFYGDFYGMSTVLNGLFH